MTSDSPQPKDYELNDFDPESETADPGTVLGTESEIGTEVGQISWETYGKSLETLVGYRGSIDVQKVRDKATSWSDKGDALTTLAGEFSNQVKSKIVDSWDSGGGQSASAAVQRYADQLSVLPVVIEAVAHSLNFSADFLDTTRKNIPDEEGKLVDGTSIVENNGGPAETQASREQLKQLLEERANDVMNQIFLPGAKSADAAMPVFPLPKPVTQDLPDPTGQQPGGQQPGGQQPGGQQPGGQQPGGQQPGLQQAAALDQIGQERQDLEAARQELEKQAELQQEALQQQQQALEQQPGAQQMLQAAQQGLQQLGQMGEQLSTAAQQALQQAGITGLPGMPALQDAVKNYQSALQKAGKLPAGLGGGAPGGGSPGSSLAAKSMPAPNVEKAAKLFPRASLAGTTTGQSVNAVAAQAGQGMPMGGMPMGGGGAGGAAQGGQQKDHKRADYLDSTEWLEEGIGDAQIVAKPVVDQ